MSTFVLVVFCLHGFHVSFQLAALAVCDFPLRTEVSRIETAIRLVVQLAFTIWAGFLLWA